MPRLSIQFITLYLKKNYNTTASGEWRPAGVLGVQDQPVCQDPRDMVCKEPHGGGALHLELCPASGQNEKDLLSMEQQIPIPKG